VCQREDRGRGDTGSGATGNGPRAAFWPGPDWCPRPFFPLFFVLTFSFYVFFITFAKKAPNQFKPISKFSKIKDNVLRQQKNNKTNFVIKLKKLEQKVLLA
jgi:hypothetical protein